MTKQRSVSMKPESNPAEPVDEWCDTVKEVLQISYSRYHKLVQ